MKISSQQLMTELHDMVRSHTERAQALGRLPENVQMCRASPNAWNALECLDHLNRYGEFYLPELERAIAKAEPGTDPIFRSGWLGNKSALSMLPNGGGSISKMNTFKDKNPSVDGMRPQPLQTFLQQQERLQKLLEKAALVSLTATKTATTLPLIKFRLGDTLRFIIYHQERHMQQAERTANS